MRAYEYLQAEPTKHLTLRHLNKLKHIRKKIKKERQDKLNLVSAMYADPNQQAQQLEVQENSLENLKDEISNLIDAAEIEQDKKAHIQSMAINAVKHQRKP